MALKFVTLPRVFPNQPIWGAARIPFTFVITQDAPDGFTASMKVLGDKPFDGNRKDLGGFCAHKSYDEAVAACEKIYRNRDA